jgi:hypothetical protein
VRFPPASTTFLAGLSGLAVLAALAACTDGTGRADAGDLPAPDLPAAIDAPAPDDAPDRDAPPGDSGADAIVDIPTDGARDTFLDPDDASPGDGIDGDAGIAPTDTPDASPDAPPDDDATDAGPAWQDTLGSNRDRLLATYLDFLEIHAATPQSNGLSAALVSTVCDLWDALDPSSRAVFLTVTARLQGSRLAVDGRSMLWHVVSLQRIAGGQGATATQVGTCGGGEYNRLMLSQDATLHAALEAAVAHRGAMLPGGYDVADAPGGTAWRDTHDLAGPHDPFDRSAETDAGAPRAQAHWFADPASDRASRPLGRLDLEDLVDPYALEVDQDYDCVHASNPLCTYTLYGPLCAPRPAATGVAIHERTYGDIAADYRPAGCE